MPPKIDLSGQRFGRLVVIKLAGARRYTTTTSYIWLCQCDCGRTSEVRGQNLRRGQTHSCGCIRREVASTRTRRHGETAALSGRRTPDYRRWQYIKHDYPDQMDPAWVASYETYLAAVGHAPGPWHALLRKDKTKPYESGNVYWAVFHSGPPGRDKKRLVWNGQRKTIVQWSRVTGLSVKLIRTRLDAGWSVEVALASPPQQ